VVWACYPSHMGNVNRMVVQADLGIRVRLYSQNKYRKGWQCDSSDRAPACQAMSSNPNTTKSKKRKGLFWLTVSVRDWLVLLHWGLWWGRTRQCDCSVCWSRAAHFGVVGREKKGRSGVLIYPFKGMPSVTSFPPTRPCLLRFHHIQ
jgi:hypothetical protein